MFVCLPFLYLKLFCKPKRYRCKFDFIISELRQESKKKGMDLDTAKALWILRHFEEAEDLFLSIWQRLFFDVTLCVVLIAILRVSCLPVRETIMSFDIIDLVLQFAAIFLAVAAIAFFKKALPPPPTHTDMRHILRSALLDESSLFPSQYNHSVQKKCGIDYSKPREQELHLHLEAQLRNYKSSLQKFDIIIPAFEIIVLGAFVMASSWIAVLACLDV